MQIRRVRLGLATIVCSLLMSAISWESGLFSDDLSVSPVLRAASLDHTALQEDARTVVDSAHVPSSAVLGRYCVTCHNDKRRSGNLSLENLDPDQPSQNPQVWERVIRKLRARAMPPVGLPRPDTEFTKGLITRLEMALDAYGAEHPNPGETVVRRLTRVEYANTVRDLLDLEVNVQSMLIGDDADSNGFDNNADVLSLSSARLDRYLSAAHKIAMLATGDQSMGANSVRYPVSKSTVQDSRMSEDLPFGSRGGIAVRHHFPLEGEYSLRIRLRRQVYGYIMGLGHAHHLDVRLDDRRVNMFTIGGDYRGQLPPLTFAGNLTDYVSSEWEAYALNADAKFEVRFQATAGMHTLGVTFIDERVLPTGPVQPPLRDFALALDEEWNGDAAIESIEIAGPAGTMAPGDTPSRRKIFVCRPEAPHEQRTCATTIISNLAGQAFRRPVRPDDIPPLLQLFESGARERGFEYGIEQVIEALLVDPEFLYRVENRPASVAAGSVSRVDDVALASRLSFFLWSTGPDEELLRLAEQRSLTNRAVLEAQVRRMIQSPRANALVENFARQWLGIQKLSMLSPDSNLFPQFDDNLRQAFQTETGLFLRSQILEDRSISDLLTANYTFVNDRLARHYGIPEVYGNHFRRVLLNDERRIGLLGQGSVLLATSYPTRTSPVLRGKWVLGTLLGSPPAPPPPDVPALPERGKNATAQSVRERLEAHRKNPMCASCHSRIDPPGFAMENFDAIGTWRETNETGVPVDPSGALTDGSRFKNVVEFRRLLDVHSEELVQTVVEKLMAYSIGRGLEWYDAPAVRKVVKESADHDYRWSSIILNIVQSTPFLYRRVR
jgi:Protein of unknown function (DUF1592)/Protein of unknown function (DUF1588)/Protein of unknown function (DUF1585)/Protein of unknown function (DUF1587)/Protein of unknown function (DUF1595)/Planctomycete cytochrome C